MPDIHLSPRRLGHVNLWVSDLERTVAFYEAVCGLELVRRERDLCIAFHSNGNTHHDVGIIETSRGVDRYGRNGILQIPKHRGTAAGLNHLGWEMENEKQLVDAYKRARASGFPIDRTVDHLISHSVYLSDPDGNSHEFYADQSRDWRSVFNLDREDEVTDVWDPLAVPSATDTHYNVDPPIRRVESAPLHPSHLTDVVIATARFDDMRRFFESVAGLAMLDTAAGAKRSALFAGAAERPDLVLVEVGAGEPTGLRSFTFALSEPADQPRVLDALGRKGVEAEALRDERGREAIVVRDPDRFEIRFCPPPALAGGSLIEPDPVTLPST